MSTIGSLIVKFSADIKDLTGGMDRVMKSTSDFGKFAATSFDVGAKALTAMGAATSAIGVNATRMAIDFESSFAGVKKTLDATDEEFTQLSAGLRAMAQEVPANVNELNRIAESAGALGIAKEGVLEFTKVISQVSTTTDLTADAAANSFARIANIVGISSNDFEKLGSTIVDLGNKGATTESEITAMAMRIAGAGKTVGLSAADIAGFAASLSNVGIEAEAGGTAISKLMINIASDVSAGGDSIERWANVAGMSADKFSQAFKTNAADAIATFVQGLGKIQKSGGDVFATLETLDIKEVRLRDATLRLASAGDMVSKTLDTARTAWAENSALSAEAGKRYETTASQLQLFQNKLADTQITIGTALLPVLLKLLEASQPILAMIKNMADGFAALDPQAQMLIAGFTALSAVFYPAVIAVAGFTRAIQTLIPLVTSLWGIIAAHPFVAIGVAVAALAVLTYKNWDEIHAATVKLRKGFNAIIASGLDPVISAITKARDTVITLCKQIADGVQTYLGTKILAIFDKVKAGIEQVKGYFKGLYDAVVGHSYIPDMVEEIGDHMRNLDITMTAPARNAVVNTGRVIMDGTTTWGQTINQFASTANQTWGTISSTFAGNLARMTDEAVNGGEVVKQIGIQLMTNMITLFLGIATQWAVSLFTQMAATTSANAAQTASHAAMEAAKTAATVAGETARLGIVTATNKVIMGGVIATLAGIGAVGNAALATMQVVVSTTSAVLAAIGASLAASIVGSPMAPAYFAAAGVVGSLGTAAVGAGAGALQAALGAAISVATGALLTPFASGGIALGPTAGLLGEAGSAEAAIPLNARGAKFMQSAMGFGSNGTQVINVYLDRRKLTEAIVKGMPDVIHTKLGFT
jgi:TP901 family phage tail tape measure protein